MKPEILEKRPLVFTAQSKQFFYCRDAVCEFVFLNDAIPINPFRAFEYFLGDRVRRDDVRRANNNLIYRSDEFWVFGATIANGVMAEIRLAKDNGKPIRFFSIGARVENIRPLKVEQLSFEQEIHNQMRASKGELLQWLSDTTPENTAQLGLF